jgi:mannosylglycerate hydrolase
MEATTGANDRRPRRRIAIVPHTHWDREWYEPFETFRMRLVEVVDDVLDLLEGDPSYRHFVLDGQTAAVDDYLEIRPEHAPRVKALVDAGRLSIGPWTILMDEFLVSGETIVRNLAAGIERATGLGGAMPVGYLPDMFGHIAQMPQILTQFGLDHAVVWRGVPAAVTRSAFRWVAPDGSAVRAEYLVTGYGNGAAVPRDAARFLGRLCANLEEVSTFLPDGAPLLLLNGTDHQAPQPWLGAVVADVNACQDEVQLEITSLTAYLAEAPGDGLETWRGELRSGARANLLMGVASNRVDVKRAAARAERALERRAEPLATLFLPPERWPAPYLDRAWRRLVHNSAHDSVCACSHDEVVEAVLTRYAEATRLAEGVAERALAALARSLPDPGQTVVNVSARRRGGVVELVAPADGPPGPDLQVVAEVPALPGALTLDGPTVLGLLHHMEGTRLSEDAYVVDAALDEPARNEPAEAVAPAGKEGVHLRLTIAGTPAEDPNVETVKRELLSRLATDPERPVHVVIDQHPTRRTVARVEPVDGFGWAPLLPARLGSPVEVTEDGGLVTLANSLVSVTVGAADGTFAVDGVPGFGRLVDGGDHGDTYNYSPPVHDAVVDAPEATEVRVRERGPVRATADVVCRYRWPERVDEAGGRRAGGVAVTVTTTVQVVADEATVRVCTRFENPCRDHRLRAHFPLPDPATGSRAECAFTVVERGLAAEGRPDELGLPTFPSRRFVTAGGLTLVHDGLLEYELVDLDETGTHATTLALTVLRSTGMLSRVGMVNRPLPAGPLLPLRGSQCLGPVEARYALRVGDCDPYALVDDVLLPLEVVHAPGGGGRAVSGSALSVDGGVVSSLRRVPGGVELRVFNPTDQPVDVSVPGWEGWLVDLLGRPVTPFAETFPLRPHGIATARASAV